MFNICSKNKEITLEDFRMIWFMEYAHRTWGRFIGGFFTLPAAYFWYRGYLKAGMKGRVVALGALIGIQGLMGWYMVKSGLEDRFHKPDDVPRVSQYRLAAHLSLAFLLYTGFLWSALDHLLPAQTLPAHGEFRAIASKAALRFRKMAHTTKGLIFLTAVSGEHEILFFRLKFLSKLRIFSNLLFDFSTFRCICCWS